MEADVYHLEVVVFDLSCALLPEISEIYGVEIGDRKGFGQEESEPVVSSGGEGVFDFCKAHHCPVECVDIMSGSG